MSTKKTTAKKRAPALKKKAKAPPPAKKAKAKSSAPKKKRGRPKRFTAPKTERPTMADPLRQVADWIVAGISDAAIDEALIELTGTSRAKATKLRAAAYLYLAELIAADPDTRKTWHIATRLELYRRTLQIHDYKTARDILRDLAQLEGLYPKLAAKAAAKDPAGAGTSLEGIPTAEGYPTVQ